MGWVKDLNFEPTWIFIYDTANVFYNKYSLCENISILLSLTILVLCCAS